MKVAVWAFILHLRERLRQVSFKRYRAHAHGQSGSAQPCKCGRSRESTDHLTTLSQEFLC